MSHEGNEKLNEILGGLLASYEGLQALAEVQQSDFMKEITDADGRIDMVKVASRAERIRIERADPQPLQADHQYMSRSQVEALLTKLTWPGRQEMVYPHEMAAALRSALRGFDAPTDEVQPKIKHPYELGPVDFVNNPTHRADILKGLDGFLGLDYTLDANPVEQGPAEAAKAWIRQVMQWAGCTKGYQEQLESFTADTRETAIAEKLDKIGRGLIKPVIEYDQDVNVIRQCIENVQAAMGRLRDDCELFLVEDYLTAHLKHVTEVQYNRKPVLDLKKIVEIMRDWVEEESLASHVKFDMVNMIESLDKLIAQHIGEDVPVAVDAQTTTESRTSHSLGAVMSAAHAHPLDIDQTALQEVALWLNSIIANNPGFHNLGKEGYIVVPSSNNLSGNVIDSVRGYLISYGQGEHMASELRSQAALRGDLSINNMPEWFATTYGHTSKGGFAALMYHTMTQVAAQENPKTVYISSSELGKLEEAIRNDQPFALVDHIKSAIKSDAK